MSIFASSALLVFVLMLCIAASSLALRSSSLAVLKGLSSARAAPAAVRQMSMSATVKGMSVRDFGNILSAPDSRTLYQIIDVREKNELAVASIKGADIVNLPLSEADIWGPKVEAGQLLDAAKPTICLCKAGMRSMKMAQFLVGRATFQEVYNVEGGIQQYANAVDPSIPMY